jgi:type I restriction enzyme S subunit
MSFPRYERYKDSGVDWLGEVPEHWQVRSFRHSARIKNGTDFKHIEVEDGGYPVVGSGGPFARVSQFMYDKPSVLLGRKGTIDKPLYMDTPFWAVDTMYYTEIAADSVPKYVFYYSKCIPFDLFTYGSALPSMTQTTLHALDMPVPNLQDQANIVLFLDNEILKIDVLIEEQRRLIDLLKEKRQSVISLAVTKGINAGVPMKQTGDRWLGSIPDHWTVVGAKFVSTIFVPQRNKPELNQEGDGMPWITMDQMKEIEVANSGYWVSQEAAQAAGTRTLNKGAVIASCVGNFGVASVNLCDVVINQQLQAFIPNSRIRTSFLRYRVESAKSYFEEIGTAATIPYVNQQGFASLPISLPPLGEQDKIVVHLDSVISDIDGLIASATDAAVILQERRSALISAAVTGKIDVRKYIPKEAA